MDQNGKTEYERGYEDGIAEALDVVIGTPELAKLLNVSGARVRQLVQSYGRGRKLDTGRGSIWLFTPEDVVFYQNRGAKRNG